MTPELRLAALVEKVSGIVLGERDVPRLGRIARERAKASGFPDLKSYVDALHKAPEGAEWREILGRITVNESSLFRGPQQIAALAGSVVPTQIERGRAAIRIWSAGCARGEEPATIAVALAESEALRGFDWTILATDVDEEALERAKTGTFSRRAMRKVPPDYVERYFDHRGDRFQLTAHLRKKIEYRFFNLVQFPWSIPEGPFDAIFLRNVMIYFREDAQIRVVASIAPHLVSGGCLFVGPSETLRQVAPQFSTRDFGDCFAYTVSRSSEVTAIGGRHEARIAPGYPDIADGPAAPFRSPSGVIRALERDDHAAADQILRLSPMAPDDPVGHAIAGIVAERAGRIDDAIRAFRAASYLDVSLFQVRFMMARCLALAGWEQRALIELRALADLLNTGRENALPWADRLGLPTRDAVKRACDEGLTRLKTRTRRD